jgi:hypothetical protein
MSKYLEEARQAYLTNNRGLQLADLDKQHVIKEIQREVLEAAANGEKTTRLHLFGGDRWFADDLMRIAIEMGYNAHVEHNNRDRTAEVVIYWSLR